MPVFNLRLSVFFSALVHSLVFLSSSLSAASIDWQKDLSDRGFSAKSLNRFELISSGRIKTDEDLRLKIRSGATSDQCQMRIHLKNRVTPSSAAESVSLQMKIIKNLTSPRVSPYPGQWSDRVQCDLKLRGEVKELDGLNYFSGFSNRRLNLSVCTEEQVHFQSAVIFFANTNLRRLFHSEIHCQRQATLEQLILAISQENRQWQNVSIGVR